MFQMTLIGRLIADPTLRTVTSHGKELKVCNFRTATNVGENTYFTDVAVWNGAAETCAKYLFKGREVCVVGRPSARHSKRESDGAIFDHLVCNAERVQFLGSGRKEVADNAQPANDGDIPVEIPA